MNSFNNLEFGKIKEMLAGFALSGNAKKKALSLEPTLNEKEAANRMGETTEAKNVLESQGSPPLPYMLNFGELFAHLKAGGMLGPEQLSEISKFLSSCRQMKTYLKKAEMLGVAIAYYGGYIDAITPLKEEIDGAIRNEMVDDNASSELKNLRRKLENAKMGVKSKLESLLKNNKKWFADGYITTRQGRDVLPVKKEFKNQVSGSVVEISNTGGTYFIEPTAVRKLQDEISQLEIQQDNEIIKILYTLSGTVEGYVTELERNITYSEILDFLFAKAKLSLSMGANPVVVRSGKKIEIISGRHPFIDKDSCVPLDFKIGNGIDGVIITGANTGGKTVALKTIGLLSLMAQSGLHVTADGGSQFAMLANVLCDIGDGQSITENLSTFSAHIKSIIGILEETTHESLILLDELGSGTDPGEGMGLAIAILDELLNRDCLFVATTHYPEVKDYGNQTERVINARMAFDKETLRPLYKLQIGQSGESCAFYIAQQLGLAPSMLKRAHMATYKENQSYGEVKTEQRFKAKSKIVRAQPKAEKTVVMGFNRGDSVSVLPDGETGIVYQPNDNMGMVGVQVQKEKKMVNHKRLKLLVAADQLYPEDYDFSIIFDSVENRKARHDMDRKHNPSLIINC